jgi:hypothetical protein
MEDEMADGNDLSRIKKSRWAITCLAIEKVTQDEKQINLRLYFADTAQREAFVVAGSLRKNKARIVGVCRDVLRNHQEPRKRGDLMQPGVTPDLLETLRAAAKAANAKNGGVFLREKMGYWIDFGRGKRKQNTQKGRPRSVPISKFKQRGRELASCGATKRLQIDMGGAGDAVRALIDETTLTHSEFFCALIDHICNRREANIDSSQPLSQIDASTLPGVVIES